MNNCHVLHPEIIRGEGFISLIFSGHHPALPPLAAEEVESIVYVEEDEDESRF